MKFMKKILCLIVAVAMLLSTMSVTVFADNAVAKVGNTEYSTIDDAIANWTNGTTLTLMADVQLSDVIKLSSTEYHILDLGIYTMTAANNKDAIQYVINGRSSASYALDIKADATTPGGITATGCSVVRHTKPLTGAPSKDRPITRFYGGVFNATYVVRQGGTFGAGYTGANAPYFQFYGGEYNGTIYTNRSQNQFYGGTFNGSMQMSVDSSAYTLIAGGTFKNLSNLMGSDLNSDKFTIGSSKGANNGSVCIDENGNYVITTTTPSDAEASVASNYNSSNYFYYSTVNTSGMYYEDVYDALEGNKTGTVTVFADEVDLTDSSFAGTIVVPEGKEITITVDEGTTPQWTVTANDNSAVTYKNAEGNVVVRNENGSFAEAVPAPTQVNVSTLAELQTALADTSNNLPVVFTQPIVISAEDNVTLDLNGKTVTYNSTTQGEAMITNKGTLTINDSGSTGVINYNYTGAADSSYGKGNYTISNAGTLTVNGGKITIANLRAHAKYPIDNNSTTGDAILVINGGHLYNYNTSAIRQFCNSTTNRNSVTVNGGIIEGYCAIWVQNPGSKTVNGSLSITGGEIKTTAAGYVNGTSDLKDVASRIYCTTEGGAWSEDSAVSITGGIINENVSLDKEAPANITVNQETATFNGNVEIPTPAKIVATVNGEEFTSLQQALNYAANSTGNVTVDIISDIDLTDVDWTPVSVSAPGYPMVTVNGNNHVITGLNDMLFASTWAGKSGLIINELTIKDSIIEHDVQDSAGNIGVGAFIGYPQASAVITLNDCHLVNSTVNGGHWTGGLIGMAGGYNGTDGPVFMDLTITNCSVTNSYVTGKGSVGGIIGHGSCSAWTNVVIENTTVSGNTITSTGSSTDKAGAVMGTIGAAGQETTVNGVTKTGGASVSATVSDNTVTSNNTAITTIYGRQGTSTGDLVVSGGNYEYYPIEENVVYANPIEGYEIAQNTDGTYGVIEKVVALAKIGDDEYETVAAALEAAKEAGIKDLTITLVGETTKESALALEDSFDLVYNTAFDNVTIKQEDPSKVYYIDTIYTGDRTSSDGKFVFDGVNIMITSQIWFECDVVLKNNSVIERYKDTKNFIYYGDITIEPGSVFKSEIDDVYAGSITVDGGIENGTYTEVPGYHSIYLDVRDGNSLVLKNGAYAKFNAANEVGRLTLNGNALVYDSKLEVFNNIVMGTNALLDTDCTSTISAKVITGAGVINIDATNFDGTDIQVISADMSEFTGIINVTGNDNATYKITDKGVIITSNEPYIFGLAFHIINMDRPDENNYQVGIFAGIDSLDYEKVGFRIFDGQGNLLGEKTTTRVYDSITAGGTTITAKEYNIHSIFGMSIHFDEYWDNKTIRYQPFTVDYSGEEIPGYVYEIEDIYTK